VRPLGLRSNKLRSAANTTHPEAMEGPFSAGLGQIHESAPPLARPPGGGLGGRQTHCGKYLSARRVISFLATPCLAHFSPCHSPKLVEKSDTRKGIATQSKQSFVTANTHMLDCWPGKPIS
jgi:hypothetical protein